MRLNLASLAAVPARVQRPDYNVAGLKCGIVHLGLGAFHRAHQAVFTEDAISHSGGDWGIIGVSMRKPDVADALNEQDGLYTVETLRADPGYRVIGTIRRALCLPHATDGVLGAIAHPDTHVITLTVTENGYCLTNGEIDLSHADIQHDVREPDAPRSAVGTVLAGLARRHARGGGPVTVISCDNLSNNGPRLRKAVLTLACKRDETLSDWIASNIQFPESVVDCITPAPTSESMARTDGALGMHDAASVQREPFAQWVIENRFAAPHPDWAAAGAELVESCADYRRLKLHVLNAAHSALAYLGLERGHELVREAAADPVIARFLEQMIATEITPALPGLPVADYWKKTAQRFVNPMLDHRLAQIALDGATKLSERYSSLMIANLKADRPFAHMASVYAAWLSYMDREGTPVRGNVDRLSDPVWRVPEFRKAILEHAP